MTSGCQQCQTAYIVLGAALSDLVPHGFLLAGGSQKPEFYYDIVLGESLSEELLPYLERRMHEIVSQKHPIVLSEMVPANGALFFRHHRRYYPSHFAKKAAGPLIQVLHLAHFVDLVEGAFLQSTAELPQVTLLRIEERPPLTFQREAKQVYRVVGQVGQEGNKRVDPWELGERLGLFEVIYSRGEDFLEQRELRWRGKGEAFFFRLYETWRKVHLEEGFELVMGGGNTGSAIAEVFSTQADRFDRGEAIVAPSLLLSAVQRSLRVIDRVLPWQEGEWKGVAPLSFSSLLPSLKVRWEVGPDVELKKGGAVLTVRKKGSCYTITHAVFPSMCNVVLSILEDQEKDLSRKKELLGIVGPCVE